MGYFEPLGMKMQLFRLRETFDEGMSATIFSVAEDRGPQFRAMDTKLMGPSRMGHQTQPSDFVSNALDYFIFC